jgi:hypothetical protein
MPPSQSDRTSSSGLGEALGCPRTVIEHSQSGPAPPKTSPLSFLEEGQSLP